MNDDTTTRTASEDDVERSLRELFAADAATARQPADVAGWAEWTGAAARSARAHRRRSSVVAASAAAVVVVLGVVAVQAWRPASDALPADDPSGAATEPAPDPSGGAVDGESVLMFRGVEVPVPPAMLRPDAVRCGTPIEDAAYVRDQRLPLRSCIAQPDDPERITTVVMQPWEDVSAGNSRPGERLLADGRLEISSRIPEREVWLTVTSPDPARARQLFSGARIGKAPHGCPVRADFPEIRPAQPGTARFELERFMVDPQAETGRVCGYRTGWITGATTLTPSQVQRLRGVISEIRVISPWPPPTFDCFDTSSVNGVAGWSITLGTTTFWIDTALPCWPFLDETGRTGITSGSLVEQVQSLAAGPWVHGIGREDQLD